MSERLVVIGGDAGGMATAAQARRLRPDPSDLEIVAFEKGTRTSYSACGIPFRVGGLVDSLDDLVARTPAEFAEQDIAVHTRHEVTAIDLEAATIEVHDLDGGGLREEPYDQLLIGTGARPIRPDLPGIDLDIVHGVQTLDDADDLLRHAEQSRCSNVVVVGGGYIGLEMAEAFVQWGAQVTVVERADQVMATLDADMAELVLASMRRHDIDVRLGVAVKGFEPGRVLTDADPIDADLVVLGIGVTPNSELAGAAGIELGVRDAIRVDARQRTSADGVWAAGDCCESRHLITGEQVHIALGTTANRMARCAGINIGGGYARNTGVLGSAVTKLCDTEIGRTGLTEREAAAHGFEVGVGRIESATRSGYYPGSEPITVKLVAERGTGRLLGGQIVGGTGSAKRIDVVAAAITAGMTAQDLELTDFSYAPPFSGVWDPVLIAARQASKAARVSRSTGTVG
jgi:NADPH-dependent 2,4-dienoyl-CoA reductase/sulfur reductase-like enzyme